MAPTAEQGKRILDIDTARECLAQLPSTAESTLYSLFRTAEPLGSVALNNHLKRIIAFSDEFFAIPCFHDIQPAGETLFFSQLYSTDVKTLAEYSRFSLDFLNTVLNESWGTILRESQGLYEENLRYLLNNRKTVFLTLMNEGDEIEGEDTPLYLAAQIVLGPEDPGYGALKFYYELSKSK